LCIGKHDQHCNSTLDLDPFAAKGASCRVVGILVAYRAAPSLVDLGSRPSFVAVVAFDRIEVGPSCQAFAVVASFPVVGILPSFEVAVRIAEVASNHIEVAASYLVVGSPFEVDRILVAASFVVGPSFQVVDRTFVAVEDSRVATYLPS